jgi:hypothetical protein
MIVQYIDRAIGYEQTLTLFDDHVEIAGRKRFGTRWNKNVPLAGLDPTPSRVWARYRPYSPVAVFVFFAFLIVTVVGSMMTEPSNVYSRPREYAVLAVVGSWIVAVLVLLLFTRPIEHATFSAAGHLLPVLFVTVRRKSARADFEAFVAAVSEQIGRQARRATA